MKTYRVYMSEILEYSYDVVAENVEQAKDKIYSGDYDENTYNIVDSHGTQIDDVLEGVTE